MGSTVTLVRYTPSLVAMPVAKPEIRHAFSVATDRLQCEPESGWSDMKDMSTSIRVYEDSALIIMLSCDASHLLFVNQLDWRAFVHVQALVDGVTATPADVCITDIDETGSHGKTILFHYSVVNQGTHMVTIQWRNRGLATGTVTHRVLEVIAVPIKASS